MIPVELIGLRQWVCADVNKRPINPRNGKLASPTDSRTWDSYEQSMAFSEKSQGMFPHVGFVLTEDDPYCIIDLDTPKDSDQEVRHSKIIQAFDSYAEISQSGKGVHIITKGKTPKGFKKDNVEIYSSERYMITTGNPLHELKPINEHQPLLNKLISEMDRIHKTQVTFIDSSNIDIFDVEDLHNEIMNDPYVVNEYELLCKGDWEGRLNYQSQSDADFNMAMIICENTESDELGKRLFELSGMFRESKPRPYLNYTFSRARDKVIPKPEIDFTALKDQMLKGDTKPEPKLAPQKACIFPAGLVGEVAEYIYSAAIRPVREMALAAAIGMIAGISSRSYSISGTGLNQYLVLLGGTGTGKEGMSSGIDALYYAIAKEVPTVYGFSGPASFSSGQALMKHMAEQPCFLTILAEFGLLMQTMSGSNTPAHMVMYRQALLNLYTKSGPKASVNPSVYAKKEDNSEMVQSPNLSLLGESTPEAFYQALSEELISEGLIPRFQIIEYSGTRVTKNDNAFRLPPQGLVKKLSALVMTACHTANNKTCCSVEQDADAAKLLDLFDTHSDTMINAKDSNEVHKQLWNRAHLKALRLAALVAVGNNHHKPVIDRGAAEWAITMVTTGINLVESKFTKGEIGHGASRHEAEVRKVFQAYFTTSHETLVNSYSVPKRLLGEPVVPYTFLRRRLKSLASFKNGFKTPQDNIKAALQDMCESDIIVEIDKKTALSKYGVSSPIYVKGSGWQ